ncbi:MAG TPA: DUF2189 domain-containing protein [Lysobacter sp.]
MTQIRKVPVRQGFAWFMQAVNVGRRNPRAVFGASLLFICTLYGVGLLLVLPVAMLARGGQPDLTQIVPAIAAVFVGMVFLLPILLGGLMHVVREAEAGRPVRARDLFAPIRQKKAGALALMGLIQIVLAIVGGVVVGLLAGSDYWTNYMSAVRGAMSGSVPVMPQPEHPGLLMVVQLLFNYFSYAIMLFSVPLILFASANLSTAVKDSLHASVSNIGANALAALLFLFSVAASALVLLLLAALLSMIGGLIGGVLVMLLYIAYGAAVLVVLVAGSYFAWRDTFGDEATVAVPPASLDSIEV